MGLNYKIREMIAVGVAIGAGCKPCLLALQPMPQVRATKAEMQEVFDLARKIALPSGVYTSSGRCSDFSI